MPPYLSPLPWLLPGAVAFAFLGAAVSRRLARVLDTRPVVAWSLVVGLGIILSATLTPLYGAFETPPTDPETCDLSTIGLVPLRALVTMNDRSLNVLLFIPLGLSLGLLPSSRRTTVLILAALVLPFAIETTQMLARSLSRGCEAVDVIDNLTGLALGLAAGIFLGWLPPGIRRRDH
jgi:glycopeptide antibiotics resistance protein